MLRVPFIVLIAATVCSSKISTSPETPGVKMTTAVSRRTGALVGHKIERIAEAFQQGVTVLQWYLVLTVLDAAAILVEPTTVHMRGPVLEPSRVVQTREKFFSGSLLCS